MNEPQPAPQPNDNPAVWDLVIQEVQEFFSGPVANCLVKDMQERDAIGKERYGVRLQPFNGRDALIDAYQEIADCTVYAKQYALEHPDDADVQKLYKQSLLLVMFFKSRILAREGK